MQDQEKTREQLLAEVEVLRGQVARLEGTDQERRRSEAELARSKAILTAAIECLPFDVFATDAEDRCILQNAVSRRYYGDAVGKTSAEVCPDERILARWQEKHRRALAGEVVAGDVELPIRGELHHLHNIMSPIRVGDEIHGILGVNIDITHRVQVEQAQRQSEARYRALAESTRDIIFIVDRQGVLQYANQAASQCINIPAAEIVGKRQVDLFPPEMARSQVEKIEQIFATGAVFEYDELFHFGPAEVWLRIGLVPLRDDAGQIISVMGVCHNITDRKRSEEALQQAHDELEQRVRERTTELSQANEQLDVFRRFAETSAQGFCMGDLESRISYVNPAMCRLMGEEKPEDVVGKLFIDYYPPGFKERRAKEIIPALDRDGHWEGEQAILSRQGKLTPTLHHLFLLRDKDGRPFRRANVVTDISKRKQSEEALERERQSLWRMLQASDHERQVISYDIHDGLAQYLAAAEMQLQVFDALRESHPDEAQKSYDTARQLMRQSHTESRRLISEVRPPVIDEIGLETAISHLVHEQRRHGGPQIECRSSVQFGRLPRIQENALYRIVQEVLTNACKHSKSKQVSVTMTQEGQDVRLEVRDGGVGFDPAAIETGHFGLEGIRQRVRLLGGRLTIDSAPNLGTRLQVTVPILESQHGG